MTQQEIIEFNKRCAEFLGWKFSQEYESYDDFYGMWEKENTGVWYKESDLVENPESHRHCYVKVNGVFLQDYNYLLKFHSDWNWIMEVVEAIQKIRPLIISHNHCEIHMYEEGKNISIDIGTNSTITAVIQAINQFLIWYNEQSKTLKT